MKLGGQPGAIWWSGLTIVFFMASKPKIASGVMGKERWRLHFHAAITLSMARFDHEECFAKPIKQDLQKQILCQLNKVFQREVESVWEQDARLKEVIHEIRTLKDNIRKIVFGVYRGPLPSYFHS